MPHILVTNDDGVHSPGILALADAVTSLGTVTIVAPAAESSAIGHALTLARPLRVEEVSRRRFAVNGTPTDCVNIALAEVLDEPPDLILSGINKGYNIGDDVTYSGTVAGALEGCLLGFPSVAISLQRTGDPFDFAPAAAAAARVAAAVLGAELPPRTFLNVNVPRARARGFRVTVQGRRNHVTAVSKSFDPRHEPYYWIEEGESDWEPHDRSDYQAVRDGWISITPLHPDLTNYAALEFTEALSLGRLAEVE